MGEMRGKADLRDRSPLFIPLAEAWHVTCYCGVAADQHRPRARLTCALTVARLLRPRLHILAPATVAAQWDDPEMPYREVPS